MSSLASMPGRPLGSDSPPPSPPLLPFGQPRNGEALSHFSDLSRHLVHTLMAQDPYTSQHSARVTDIAVAFARSLGLSALDLEVLQTVSYLHDIGKIGISDKILLKPGPLTPAERTIIETHVFIGERILDRLGLPLPLIHLILHHHERWDGNGYPHGLAGEEIPLLCRILALADTYDTLTTDRPYRGALSLPEALTEMATQTAGQFDPDLLPRFIQRLSPRHFRPPHLAPAPSRRGPGPKLQPLKAGPPRLVGGRNGP